MSSKSSMPAPLPDSSGINSLSSLKQLIKPHCLFTSKSSVKVYCVSDLHADAEKNQTWVREKCILDPSTDTTNTFTVMILPGDVGSNIGRIETVFRTLTPRYDAVCFLPGNHEAWVGSDRTTLNSFEKISDILSCALRCGIYVGPLKVCCTANSISIPFPPAATVISSCEAEAAASTPISSPGVVIIPLYAWYHSGWDVEPDLVIPPVYQYAANTSHSMADHWGDFHLCKWPDTVDLSYAHSGTNHSSFLHIGDVTSLKEDNSALPKAFASINEDCFLTKVHHTSAVCSTHAAEPEWVCNPQDTIITYSHFLPRQELCPEKRYLLEGDLMKVIGSDILEQQLRTILPDIHLFGHTHIPIDLTLEGVRYVQWPLGYARQKECVMMSQNGPLLVADSACRPAVAPSRVSDPLHEKHTPVRSSTHCSAGCDADTSSNRMAWLECRRQFLVKKQASMCDSQESNADHLPNITREEALKHATHLSHTTYWSSHYTTHLRNPADMQLASWVVERRLAVQAQDRLEATYR